MKWKNFPLWLLCDITSNFKDLTNFSSKIYEVDTLQLQIAFYLFSIRLSGPKLCLFKIETFFKEKTGDPIIFAPSVLGCSKSFESGNENTFFFLVKSLLLLSIISHKINTFGPTVFQLVYPIMEVTFCKACKILLYDGFVWWKMLPTKEFLEVWEQPEVRGS